MPPLIDLTGEKFERLTVLYRTDDRVSASGRRDVVYHCICSCGNECDVLKSALTRGFTRSCGCLKKDLNRERFTKRDDVSRKLRLAYRGMVDRCYSEKNKRYGRYGGRGIRVADEWLGEDGLEKFIEWAREHGYSKGLTIDRIDNDGNYCPENCRWITNKDQSNNRSTNTLLTVDGETKTIAQWIECLGIESTRIYYYDDQKKVDYVKKKLKEKQ